MRNVKFRKLSKIWLMEICRILFCKKLSRISWKTTMWLPLLRFFGVYMNTLTSSLSRAPLITVCKRVFWQNRIFSKTGTNWLSKTSISLLRNVQNSQKIHIICKNPPFSEAQKVPKSLQKWVYRLAGFGFGSFFCKKISAFPTKTIYSGKPSTISQWIHVF